MKPIAITESDQFGYDHTFVIRPCEPGVSLAEAAKSIGHCGISHIAARFSQGVVFGRDPVRDFPDLYAPDPKSAILWPQWANIPNLHTP